MIVVNTIRELQDYLATVQLNPVGLVPTMGALHEGHLSLVKNAVEKCPIIVVSIFVNPTQFNDKNDLINYPRTPENDFTIMKKVMRSGDIVFTPDTKEMYPGEDKRKFSFGNLDNVMEALERPGHFNGVGQIVSKLFEIVKPDFAFFGLKDFQQVAVIKELVRQTKDKVKIVENPIIREPDGLAMSSRNRLLEPDIRKNAQIIFKTISKASLLINELDIPEVVSYVKEAINSVPGFNVEYFDIVDNMDLIPVSKKSDFKKDKRYFGCIAVKAGKIRLIDNIEIGLV
jgi:pantoate--beta-alanine ligase